MSGVRHRNGRRHRCSSSAWAAGDPWNQKNSGWYCGTENHMAVGNAELERRGGAGEDSNWSAAEAQGTGGYPSMENSSDTGETWHGRSFTTAWENRWSERLTDGRCLRATKTPKAVVPQMNHRNIS